MSEITQCDCCEYITETTRTRTEGPYESLNLCRLCSTTYAVRAITHPASYKESGPVMQTLCYVGNAILAAIKENEKK